MTRLITPINVAYEEAAALAAAGQTIGGCHRYSKRWFSFNSEVWPSTDGYQPSPRDKAVANNPDAYFMFVWMKEEWV